MNESEEIIRNLESEFPMLAGVAFRQARAETLASGQSILESRDGIIYEVFRMALVLNESALSHRLP